MSQELIKLIEENPNDMQLGKAVRAFYEKDKKVYDDLISENQTLKHSIEKLNERMAEIKYSNK